MLNKPTIGWAVDAATEGNPGLTEYRGMDLHTGEVMFHKRIGVATNNIGEFIAVVHAIAEMKKRNIKKPIYTDSQIAIAWVKKKTCNTSLKPGRFTDKSIELKDRALSFLNNLKIDLSEDFVLNIDGIEVMKWHTNSWGEIPADFGRK